MKTKEAMQILNCSHSAIINYIKSGKLKLNAILDNGRYDINEQSVYNMLAYRQTPSCKSNIIVIVDKNKNKHTFVIDNEVVISRVVQYLTNIQDN